MQACSSAPLSCLGRVQGDIVLVGLRDYQDEKADVIMKYTADEARVLKQYGELPENIRINDTDVSAGAAVERQVEGQDSSCSDNLPACCDSSQLHRCSFWSCGLSSKCTMLLGSFAKLT